MNAFILLSALTMGQCEAGQCTDTPAVTVEVMIKARKPVRTAVRFVMARQPVRSRIACLRENKPVRRVLGRLRRCCRG